MWVARSTPPPQRNRSARVDDALARISQYLLAHP